MSDPIETLRLPTAGGREVSASAIDFPAIIPKFDAILSRGLCVGLGDPKDQMCGEAAICVALDLPFGDEPECVASAVRSYKIRLNDSSRWVSAASRAAGLRDLGIAQIGSKGVVSDQAFRKILARKTIQVLIPKLFREVFPKNQTLLDLADRCEVEGTSSAAYAAAAYAADAATAADYAADRRGEKYLLLSAKLALETLIELKSPGALFLEAGK